MPPQSLTTTSVTVLTDFRTDCSNTVGNAADDQKREILAWVAIFTDYSWAIVGAGRIRW